MIFHLDTVSGDGLVSASDDQSWGEYNWGCVGNLISGADGSLIGDGNQNTIDILSGCSQSSTAANACQNLKVQSNWQKTLPIYPTSPIDTQ